MKSTWFGLATRFPPSLRVHLAATSFIDACCRKGLNTLRCLKHRPELQLYAYGCSEVTADEFVEIYPMLPGRIDLVSQITSALRTRSTRPQGDDQAIRGLLQLLGDLFDELKLTDAETTAIDQIRTHLKAERPWLDISDLDDDVKLVRDAYETQRGDLLGLQEQTEASRGRVKKRAGYSTLTSEQSEAVLREFDSAETNTTTEAISPPLIELRDAFSARLERCETAANQKLDEILSEKDKKIVRPVSLNYRNRIIKDSSDVDKLVEEIRSELLEQLKADVTIRII